MLATKNMNRCWIIAFLMLAVFLSGCGPAGPRALLKGRKYLERGDYSAAVGEFKRATSLMFTNAEAWNYLGVADQHAGHAADAALAYQRALTLNRDLVEAHYNLGCLWLSQNKPDVAKTEFTAFVLRRSKDPNGWNKLGVAQLRLHDLTSAEKSFSTALTLDPKNAEAFNGLGLAQVQRNRPRDAVQYFVAATRAQPDFGPALLNLATVERQYLHDNALALQHYRAYLALVPRPADWEQVNAVANDLEQEINGAAKPAPPASPTVSAAPRPERRTTQVTRTPTSPRANSAPRKSSPPEIAETKPAASRPENPAPNPPPRRPSVESETLHKMNPLNWFRSESPKPKETSTSPTNDNGSQAKPAPEPAPNSMASAAPSHTRSAKPYQLVQPAPPSFPRYLYLSPSKPRPGDRRAAGHAFAQAQQFERDRRYQDAMDYYREASQLDPSWFVAQYNCGVLAYRLKDYTLSLRAYEMALAIQPDSEDARYNFALALKAAGYATDAVNELRKILEEHSGDVRAHLALGNLYAQQMNDYPRARAQYLEVLRLDPKNPQAADIQFWLSANPP